MRLILSGLWKTKSLETSSPQAYSCRGSPRVTPSRVLSFPSGRTPSSGPGLTLWGIAQASARSQPRQISQITWNLPYYIVTSRAGHTPECTHPACSGGCGHSDFVAWDMRLPCVVCLSQTAPAFSHHRAQKP